MKQFLEKKGVNPSFHTYVIRTLSFMALGLFSSLIIGLIMETAGGLLGLAILESMGSTAMSLYGPAIGVAVAYGLNAPRLVLFAAVITGAAGAEVGGPAGSLIAALLSTEIGKLVSQETKLDIIVTPLVTIVTGIGAASIISPQIAFGLRRFGDFLGWSTAQQPFIMGIIIAIFMGLALTAPISSVAIAIMIEIDGIAAGAATVGCAAQMIGFATSSFRENRWSGFIAQGIGTSMLQIANIMKNPWIILPPTLTAAILGPVATVIFQMKNNDAGAGMGTSGFVGQIMTIHTMGSSMSVWIAIVLLHFIAPAILALIFSEWLRKAGKIKYGDMKIEQS
ncbi:PTS sugar transporter subunit IIC [Bacillus shivajii]|uniref:PTS transporter subunit IIC n=1 Tax=Bacillus shivajii TaxID=1983719 RepID=UPI001CFA2A54|nr:PTS sugar transporter subunit IIC [Bacillus shivajii]UCZ52323.1 PTS sugar transporter subunit IIC [Bacillus shivajii]